MAAGSDEAYRFDCDLCRYDGIVSEGVGLCKVCNEYLCDSCLRAHKRSNASKDHKLVQGDDLHKTRKSTTPTLAFELCTQHKNRKVAFYCADHDDVFCFECKNIEHRACHEVDKIEKICSGIQTGQAVRDLEHRSQHLVQQLNVVHEERNQDLNAFMVQRDIYVEKQNAFRSHLNNLLDRMEVAHLRKFNETMKTERQTMTGHISSLETAIAALDSGLSNLATAKSNGDDRQVIVAMKRVSVEKMDRLLKDIDKEKYKVNLEFVGDRSITDLLDNLDEIGKLTVDRTKPVPSDDRLFCNSLPAEMKNKKIVKLGEENMKMADDRSICKMRGLVFLPDDKLLICDFLNNKVKLTDVGIKVKSSISMGGHPWDIALLNSTEAVVTLPWKKTLQFVAIEDQSLQRGRAVNVKRPCWGVAVSETNVMVACHEDPGKGEVLILDHQGICRRRLGVNNDGSYSFIRPYCIAVNGAGDRLYVSDSGRGALACLALDGSVVYTYSSSEMTRPRGLLVDQQDHVYICDIGLTAIQVVTPEGRKYGTIAATSGGLTKPKVLAYRGSDRTLLVIGGQLDMCNTIQLYRFQ